MAELSHLQGAPLERSTQISDPDAVREAVRALLYGGDEDSHRSTESRYISRDSDKEDMEGDMPWYEDLAELDALIAEEVAVAFTPLPTANLLEKIDDMAEKMGGWFAAPLPIYQKRALRYAFDEMAELSSFLRAGKVNAGSASETFDRILAEAHEIVDFSRFLD